MSASPSKQATIPIGGQYLPFVPKDNQTWQADEVIRSINDDLAHLLSLPTEDFWSIVGKDESLHVCLDTYLRYKRRVYDDLREEVEGASATSQQLARRVFMVLLRMVTTCERDPGAPKREEQAQMVYNLWLLDIPKLMDVAVLYGAHNPELTRKFLSQVFDLQPRYSDDLAALAPLLVGNLAEVVGRCMAVGDRALKSGPAAAAAHVKELRDAMDYLRDAILTLTAFVACYSPAATALLQPDHGALLCTLASAHDRLLPLLARVFSQPTAQLPKQQSGKGGSAEQGAAAAGSGNGGNDTQGKLSQVAAGLRRLGYLLLLSNSCRTVPQGGRRENKSVQQVSEVRGNELMSLLMAVSSAGVAGGDGGRDEGNSGAAGGFLGLINRESHLDSQIASAILEGTLALDDAQFDYLLALTGGDPRVMDRVRNQHRQMGPSSVSSPSIGGGPGAKPGPSGSAGAGPSGSGAGTSDPAAAARRASLISQIKDLLPDFGDGFLAACLEAMDMDPEKVINALLEDKVPPHLAKMDRKLATWGGPVAQAGAGPSSSEMAAGSSGALAAMSSWNSLVGLASTSISSAAAGSTAKGASSSGAGFWRTAAGGGGGSGSLHRGTLKVLDRVDKEVRSLTSRLGDELQWEYDDEYDDSFDDLAAGGADGVADAEGDDDESAMVRPIAAPRGAGAATGTSRLGPPGRSALDASTGYNDESNRRIASSRADAGTAASGSSGAGARGTGKPPANAPVSTGAAAAAAAAAAAGIHLNGAPRRAPTMIGPATSSAGGRGGGAGAGPAGGRGGRGGRSGSGERLWVLDGKIYNYAKEGAQMVNSQQEADAVLDAARQAAQAIYGLGPGGNKGLLRQQQQQQQAGDGGDSSEDE
ncbi:hypothetical protein Vafri_7281, partial [Volvox africanus]